mmetsp:Transcript_58/g.249  ORF Transcript_58/g.249 Transcript_58/m.249 type:complete len:204 (+) Transcript_58:549-1160(+)
MLMVNHQTARRLSNNLPTWLHQQPQHLLCERKERLLHLLTTGLTQLVSASLYLITGRLHCSRPASSWTRLLLQSRHSSLRRSTRPLTSPSCLSLRRQPCPPRVRRVPRVADAALAARRTRLSGPCNALSASASCTANVWAPMLPCMAWSKPSPSGNGASPRGGTAEAVPLAASGKVESRQSSGGRTDRSATASATALGMDVTS